LQRNPHLQGYRFKDRALVGARHTQKLSPPLAVTADVENAFGSGEYNTVENADVTLALSSVIELGGQQHARVAVIDAQRSQLKIEQHVQALDLLGEVTRRYVAVVAAQEQLLLVNDGYALATDMANTVRLRAQAGLSPEAEVLRAKAAQSQARILVDVATSELSRTKNALSVLWGEAKNDFQRAQGNLFSLGETGDIDDLNARLEKHPAITALAEATRIKDAEIRLARSQRHANIEWTAGIRRLQATQDTALVAGISVPLESAPRAKGALLTALAERESSEKQRDVQMLSLRAQLADAFERRKQAITIATTLNQQVIPTLENALTETRIAYERGRYSYLEWVAAKTELIQARGQYIEAAADALKYRADIEQLTSEPLVNTVHPSP
jgi:cobalt-zinc-cadmium efflux system outer membrane protein